MFSGLVCFCLCGLFFGRDLFVFFKKVAQTTDAPSLADALGEVEAHARGLGARGNLAVGRQVVREAAVLAAVALPARVIEADVQRASHLLLFFALVAEGRSCSFLAFSFRLLAMGPPHLKKPTATKERERTRSVRYRRRITPHAWDFGESRHARRSP